MATSHFRQFLHDATSPDTDTDTPLEPDCLYGLYTSWCLLQGLTPRSDTARPGMRRCRVNLRASKRRMKGRPEADYILVTYPYAG
jgi:hypothetical protein